MRKSMKSLLAVILLATPLVLTSCEGALDDVLGEWSRPTPGNNNNHNNNTNTTPSADMTNKYRVWNGSDYDTPDIPSTAIDASTITNTINAGFYDVKGDVNLSGTITLAGDAEFLLRDGATLKMSGAIVDNTGTYNLKIYAQSEGTGMGKLDITNSSASDYPITVSKLTIHGGEIIASNTTLLRRSFQQNKVNIIYQQFNAPKSTILRSLTVEMSVPELVEGLLLVNSDFTPTKPRLYSG